jgi:hypothetical protein
VAPAPLLAARRLACNGSVAMVLTRSATERSMARLEIELTAGAATACKHAALESLRVGCPALHALPLLEYLATGSRGRVLVPSTGKRSLALTLA